MVIMASGIARGRVRTATTESRNMAAILQITGLQRDMQPSFTVYFFGIGHPCYDQLTPVKTSFPLTSITWPYRGPKLIAHRGQVFFEGDCWPGASFSIGSRAHVWLTCLFTQVVVYPKINPWGRRPVPYARRTSYVRYVMFGKSEERAFNFKS